MEKDETLALLLSVWAPELQKHWDGAKIRCPRCNRTDMRVVNLNINETEADISFRCNICGAVIICA